MLAPASSVAVEVGGQDQPKVHQKINKERLSSAGSKEASLLQLLILHSALLPLRADGGGHIMLSTFWRRGLVPER